MICYGLRSDIYLSEDIWKPDRPGEITFLEERDGLSFPFFLLQRFKRLNEGPTFCSSDTVLIVIFNQSISILQSFCRYESGFINNGIIATVTTPIA